MNKGILGYPSPLAAVQPGTGGLYGDGSDGTVTISATTVLSRDMCYDTLTVNAGVELRTNGYRVFVLNTLTCYGTLISRSNADYDSPSTGGWGQGISNSVGGGTDGAHNTSTGAGTAGLNQTNQGFGGAGGAGGAGAGGAGGAGGSAPSAFDAPSGGAGHGGVMGTADLAILQRRFWATGLVQLGAGAGGGSGGGNGAQVGPGGGSGGNILVVAARVLDGVGRLTARGGDGVTLATVNTGGSGGGGGGFVVLVSGSTSHSLTVDAPGGKGAAGNGSGSAGSNGSVGVVFPFLGA